MGEGPGVRKKPKHLFKETVLHGASAVLTKNIKPKIVPL